jgi:c-di-GMP-binding flagellar brake protein YcgR
MRSADVSLLELGANAVLRLPAGPDWDERLERLIRVPARKPVRVLVRLEVERTDWLGVDSVSAMMLNVSATGMLVEAERALDLRSELSFAFALPGVERPIQGRGFVVRHAGGRQYGVEFLSLEPGGREGIERFEP